MKTQYFLLALFFIAQASCSSGTSEKRNFASEPVGVMLSASGNLPAIEIAVELIPQADSATTARALSKIFSEARTQCADRFAKADRGAWNFTMQFDVIEKTLRVEKTPRSSLLDTDPLSACLQEKLANSPLDGFDQKKRSGLLQARLGKSL